ncbi:hypothetical protein GE115_17695 [Agromyces sp. CFH 90414]|uniref:Uncharacterized protein n=1 Tax=Agromyces agglutinans TaxID=2662258 RepID=A0A6I2FGH9_9MICO|nr:hypothetical protein [Agromyces agglutinans]MRG61696.1 hypothetical protein [Agromyces agglutinans]
MSIDLTATASEGRVRASIAVGRARGYYRVLFDAGPVDVATFAVLAGAAEEAASEWLAVQLAGGILRLVPSPAGGGGDEFLLPGEHVVALLGDDGGPELAGARALLAEHRDELPVALSDLGRASLDS